MQTTFPRLLLKHAARAPAAPAMREKEYGIWQALSWADLAELVEHLACGLHQAGLRRGDAHGGGGRQPAAPVRHHAGGAVAGCDSDSAVPGRGGRWSAYSPSTTPKCALRLPKTRSRSTSCWRFATSARN